MATGKGSLRLAIENFIETSPIGKKVIDWVDRLLHSIEQGIIGHNRSIFEEIAKDKDADSILNISDMIGGKEGHQGGMAGALGVLLGAGQTVGGSVFSATFSGLTYAANRKYKPSRLPPNLAYALLWRDPSFALGAVSEMLDQGWSENDIKAMAEIYANRVNEQVLLQQYLRGNISKDDTIAELRKRGWEESHITLLLNSTEILPNAQDMIRMSVREAFTPDIVKRFGYDVEFPSDVLKYTRQIGLKDEWVLRYWYAHWELPSPTQAYEMYHRLRPNRSKNPFTMDDLRALLKTADYPQYFRDRLAEISEAVYTRVDIRRMYQFGILDKDEVYEAYRDLGYNEERSKNITDFVIQSVDEPELSKSGKKKVMTQSALIKLYKVGIIDESELTSRLIELKYPDEDVKFMVDLAKLEASGDKAVDYRTEFNRDIKSLAENEYVLGFIDKNTASELLASINMSSTDIEDCLKVAEYKGNASKLDQVLERIQEAYMTGSIDYQAIVSIMGKLNLSGEAQARFTSLWDELKNIRGKPLTEAQYRKAWSSKIITKDVYIGAMKGLGYSDKAIDILVTMYNPESKPETEGLGEE